MTDVNASRPFSQQILPSSVFTMRPFLFSDSASVNAAVVYKMSGFMSVPANGNYNFTLVTSNVGASLAITIPPGLTSNMTTPVVTNAAMSVNFSLVLNTIYGITVLTTASANGSVALYMGLANTPRFDCGD